MSNVVAGSKVVAKQRGVNNLCISTWQSYAGRDTYHTIVCGISAAGQTAPPMFIFNSIHTGPTMKDLPEKSRLSKCDVKKDGIIP